MVLRRHGKVVTLLSVGLTGLAACAQTPMGPTVQVLPGPNRPFQAFQEDQAYCRQFAEAQVAGQVEAANNRALGAAILTTVLGAGLGAAAGGGYGAGIGAAAGATTGSAIGAGQSQGTQYGIQYQYDNAFAQCMYSRGNQVAGFVAPPPVYAAPPPPNYPPPGYAPPPGYPPPPQ